MCANLKSAYVGAILKFAGAAESVKNSGGGRGWAVKVDQPLVEEVHIIPKFVLFMNVRLCHHMRQRVH